MKMDVAVAKTLFETKPKYYLVLNDEYYIKISKNRYYEIKRIYFNDKKENLNCYEKED